MDATHTFKGSASSRSLTSSSGARAAHPETGACRTLRRAAAMGGSMHANAARAAPALRGYVSTCMRDVHRCVVLARTDIVIERARRTQALQCRKVGPSRPAP